MPEKEICSKCANEFECGRKDNSCWCSKLTINKENLNVLSEEYDGCLCPFCLQKFEDSTKMNEISVNK